MSDQTLIKKINHVVKCLNLCNEREGNVVRKIMTEDWEDRLSSLNDKLPSGNGFDSGTTVNMDKSKDNKIVLETSFHHMDDVGSYCGWSYHTITVTPDFLNGFEMKISSKDERMPYDKRESGSLKDNGFLDFLYEAFYDSLSSRS